MSEIIINWKASDILRKQELVKDGKAGKVDRTIQIYVESLTSEERAEAVEVGSFDSKTGNIFLNLSGKYPIPPDSLEKPAPCYCPENHFLDAEPTLADAIRIRKEIRAADATYHEWYEKSKAWKEKREAAAEAERKELRARDNAEAERKETAKQEKKLAYEKERADWIAQHGSQYLKDLLEIDVDPEKVYIMERAEKEFPGFVVDYENHAEWDASRCDMPNGDILEKVKEYRAKGFEAFPVILENYPVATDEDHPDHFEECQALVIREFMGKYDLVWTA